MSKSAKYFLIGAMIAFILIGSISPVYALKKVSRSPYLGAIVVDARDR